MKSEEDKVEATVAATAVCAAVAIMLFAGTYAVWFSAHGSSISTDSANWGTFADFVGGLSNPIVSLATLVIVARAYLLQRREMMETKQALLDQAAEQKRLSEISALQAQIEGRTALLSIRLQRHANILTDIQRLSATQFHPGVGMLSLSSDGRLLNTIGEVKDEITKLIPGAANSKSEIVTEEEHLVLLIRELELLEVGKREEPAVND